MAGLREGALVFVANEGPGRVASTSGSAVTILLLSSRKVVTPSPRRFRPALAAPHAEALLKELASPLARSRAAPAVKESMDLASGSLDAQALVGAFRALAATGSLDPEVLTAMVFLEAMFGAELAAVLGLTRSEVASRIVREPERAVDPAELEWLDVLHEARVVPAKSTPLDGPMRPIPIEKASAWKTWRLAFDALERLRMYPVIVEARFLGREPADVSRLARRLRDGFVTKGDWPKTVRLSVEEPMLVVVPHRSPWISAAWLGFGGVNACPPPEANARILRQLHDEWAAFPVVFDTGSVELVVRAPPESPRDVGRAMKTQLAWSEDLRLSERQELERWTRSRHWTVWWD